jgi:hypothetical protein
MKLSEILRSKQTNCQTPTTASSTTDGSKYFTSTKPYIPSAISTQNNGSSMLKVSVNLTDSLGGIGGGRANSSTNEISTSKTKYNENHGLKKSAGQIIASPSPGSKVLGPKRLNTNENMINSDLVSLTY